MKRNHDTAAVPATPKAGAAVFLFPRTIWLVAVYRIITLVAVCLASETYRSDIND